MKTILNIEEIKLELKSRLSNNRYVHTSSVVATLGFFISILKDKHEELQTSYANEILLAGWLHDSCKELKNEEQLSLASKYNITIYDADLEHPNLLHSRVGAKWVEEQYQISSKVILDAIAEHTFGSPTMSLASKLLFLSDMVEPLRDKKSLARSFDHALMVNDFGGPLGKIRKTIIIDKNLEKALLEAMDSKIKYVIDKSQTLHPLGIEARNALLKKLS